MRLPASGILASHSGAQLEYQRGFATWRHSFSGFNCTTVSNISIGAGSVAVSERPALPWTVSTSGNCLSTFSAAVVVAVAVGGGVGLAVGFAARQFGWPTGFVGPLTGGIVSALTIAIYQSRAARSDRGKP